MVVRSLKGEYYEKKCLWVFCSCLTGDDARASEIRHTHTGGRWFLTALQWLIQFHKVSQGPDPGMKDALVKLEPEVIANPKGIAVNLSIVKSSLEP